MLHIPSPIPLVVARVWSVVETKPMDAATAKPMRLKEPDLCWNLILMKISE